MVISAAREELGDLGPAIAVDLLGLDDLDVLLPRPLILLDVRVQVVVPPFATLLPDPPRESLRDEAPVLGSVLFHALR